MIRIERLSDPQVEIDPTAVDDALKKVEKLADSNKLRSRDFPPLWLDDAFRRWLRESQSTKCCYCERKRDLKRESDVEHFRPKCTVTDVEGHPGYWWLAYEPANLLFSCRGCNQEHKKNNFPLINEDKRAWKPGPELDEEEPILINPLVEDPEQFFEYNWQGDNQLPCGKVLFVMIRGSDIEGRGERSWRILGLNRGEVAGRDGRASRLPQIRAAAESLLIAKARGDELFEAKASEIIRQWTSATRKYAGFARYFFKVYGLGDYVAND